jgi:hypothetical protein
LFDTLDVFDSRDIDAQNADGKKYAEQIQPLIQLADEKVALLMHDFFHDYHHEGIKRALDEYSSEHKINYAPIGDGMSVVVFPSG